jgi:hypothetical protein
MQRTRSIREEVVIGTDAEGMRINDYCVYCFRDGAFTEPNISREQMTRT